MIEVISGNREFLESLRSKSATFILSLSGTDTANIDGITQAGIPGMIYLTPTLDAEFLTTGEVKSLENIAKTPKGVPTPALITRAIHLLYPFAHIELLDLGLRVLPKVDEVTTHSLGIEPSGSITTGAGIDAKALFDKGVEFGERYTTEDDYIILGESVPSGTTTATATAIGLGYDARGLFSSSFRNVPNSIRDRSIDDALKIVEGMDDIFDILGSLSDNMLIFNAGFIIGLNGRIATILAGGTQMASLLLVVDSIARYMGSRFDSSNLALATTKWVAEDPHSNIKSLLEMLDFPIDAYYADFDFSLSSHPALKLYDKGEAKEGVGAGGALVYGLLNGLTPNEITRGVEEFLR
jgi:uncharacterized protein (TIGR00303 family)